MISCFWYFIWIKKIIIVISGNPSSFSLFYVYKDFKTLSSVGLKQ